MVIIGTDQSFRELRPLLSTELTYNPVKCGTSQLGSGRSMSKVNDGNVIVESFSLNRTRLLHHEPIASGASGESHRPIWRLHLKSSRHHPGSRNCKQTSNANTLNSPNANDHPVRGALHSSASFLCLPSITMPWI